jgi:hypothetical protein
MQIEEPGTGRRFEEALAEVQGWHLHFAERVTDEYRRFLYLAATAGFEVTPSRTVDEAWHLHLRWRHYEEVLCRQILGRPLDHRPAAGDPADQERCRRQYEKTVALYERAFLRPPPRDIWPEPIPRDDRQGQESRRRGRKLGRGIAVGTGLAGIAAYSFGYPMTALFLAVVATIIALLAHRVFRPRRRSRNGAGCGGSCGSGEGWSDDGPKGGDASCGGGGCGGGD